MLHLLNILCGRKKTNKLIFQSNQKSIVFVFDGKRLLLTLNLIQSHPNVVLKVNEVKKTAENQLINFPCFNFECLAFISERYKQIL